jgi:hypothetical protein
VVWQQTKARLNLKNFYFLIFRAATLEGWKCAVVEQEPDLLSWASGSNSGIACTVVDTEPGLWSLQQAYGPTSFNKKFTRVRHKMRAPAEASIGYIFVDGQYADHSSDPTGTDTKNQGHIRLLVALRPNHCGANCFGSRVTNRPRSLEWSR